MSKPWEQEWTQDASIYVVKSDDAEQVAICVAPEFEDATDRAKFLAAAPDMARALQCVLYAERLGPVSKAEAVSMARQALEKAGVPL